MSSWFKGPSFTQMLGQQIKWGASSAISGAVTQGISGMARQVIGGMFGGGYSPGFQHGYNRGIGYNPYTGNHGVTPWTHQGYAGAGGSGGGLAGILQAVVSPITNLLGVGQNNGYPNPMHAGQYPYYAQMYPPVAPYMRHNMIGANQYAMAQYYNRGCYGV